MRKGPTSFFVSGCSRWYFLIKKSVGNGPGHNGATLRGPVQPVACPRLRHRPHEAGLHSNSDDKGRRRAVLAPFPAGYFCGRRGCRASIRPTSCFGSSRSSRSSGTSPPSFRIPKSPGSQYELFPNRQIERSRAHPAPVSGQSASRPISGGVWHGLLLHLQTAQGLPQVPPQQRPARDDLSPHPRSSAADRRALQYPLAT